MAIPNTAAQLRIERQLKDERRTVDFDTFDIQIQQLLSMLDTNQIWISPAYQRKFRWNQERCSQFIESILLGIPVPSLFMATNSDNSWEVVDGVQRISTLVKFAGTPELRADLNVGDALILTDLKKLTEFNHCSLDQLPPTVQQHFATRPAKVITLNDKSDNDVRYDLFERLNTGGVVLSPQEIRDCVYRGTFANRLEEWSKEENFKRVVKLTTLQARDATAEECVLRFFAFRDKYKNFDHAVSEFLSTYMKEATKDFDYGVGNAVFQRTFSELARVFPNGIRRPGGKNTTPLNLYEGIAVGASFALEEVRVLNVTGIEDWMKSADLRKFTTGATNDKAAVIGRIEFCRDRFLGKPYVPNAAS